MWTEDVKRRLLSLAFPVLLFALLLCIANLPILDRFSHNIHVSSAEVGVAKYPQTFPHANRKYTELRLNLWTGGLREVPVVGKHAWHNGSDSLRIEVILNETALGSETCVATFESAESLGDRTFEFPVKPIPLADQYAIGTDRERLYLRDLTSKSSETVSCLAPSEFSSSCSWLKGTERFCRVIWGSNSTVGTMELWSFAGGRLERVGSWPASIPPQSIMRVYSDNGNLYSLAPDGLSVELHAIDDAAYLGNLKLPVGVELWLQADSKQFGSTAVELLADTGVLLLARGSEKKYVSLKCSQTRDLPSGELIAIWDSREGDTVFFADVNGNRDAQKLIAFDLSRNRTLWTLETPSVLTNARLLSSGEFAVGTFEYGGRFRLLSPSDGEVIKEQIPFVWVVWCVPVLLLALFLWVWTWVASHSSTPLAAWTSQYSVWFCLIALDVAYCLRWSKLGSSSALLSALVGVLAAILVCSCIPLILRPIRWSLGYLPLVAAVVVVALALQVLVRFDARNHLLWILLFGLPSLIGLFVLRMSGWRIVLPDEKYRWDKIRPATTLSLQDLFIAAAVSAVLIVTLRPLIYFLALPKFHIGLAIGGGLLAVWIVTQLVLLLALRKKGQAIAFWSSISGMLVLIGERIYDFRWGVPDYSAFRQWLAMYFCSGACCGIMVSVFLLGHACAGYRLQRMRKPSADKPRAQG